MKLKRVFRMYLVIVLLCGLVVGFGLPQDANAIDCYYKGYVVETALDTVGLTLGFFREKPIDVGVFGVILSTVNIPNLGLENRLRSAHQNNTKVGIQTNSGGPTCPTPDLSVPGMTSVGILMRVLPPSVVP